MTSCEFRILGPLQARCGGQLVPVRGVREQVALAVLLLEAGNVVPLDRFTEAVWDQDPPPAAAKAVRNTVSVLRHRLVRAGAGTLIETRPPGYQLRLGASSLDAQQFQQQVTAARKLSGAQAPRAAAGLRAALGLWRGPALAGIGGAVIEAAAVWLEEQRLAVLEMCLDLELGLGDHQQLCAELQQLVSQWPLREHLVGQLMLALYRSGRQADALNAFHRLGQRLRTELGILPSAEVTKLHQAILRQDPTLDAVGHQGPPPWCLGNGPASALETAARLRRPPRGRRSSRWADTRS